MSWSNSTHDSSGIPIIWINSTHDSTEKHASLNRLIFQLWVVRMLEIRLTIFVIKLPLQSIISPFEWWFIALHWIIALQQCFIQLTIQVASSENESIKPTTQALFPRIYSIQLMSLVASENLNSHQLMTQADDCWIRINTWISSE